MGDPEHSQLSCLGSAAGRTHVLMALCRRFKVHLSQLHVCMYFEKEN